MSAELIDADKNARRVALGEAVGPEIGNPDIMLGYDDEHDALMAAVDRIAARLFLAGYIVTEVGQYRAAYRFVPEVSFGPKIDFAKLTRGKK